MAVDFFPSFDEQLNSSGFSLTKSFVWKDPAVRVHFLGVCLTIFMSPYPEPYDSVPVKSLVRILLVLSC